MLQPKDTDWLNGYKNKTHIYTVCKKPTSDLKTHATENERMEKYILRKAFLSLLAILWNSAFKWVSLSFSPLPLASLLSSAICKASSDNHFALCRVHHAKCQTG